MSREAHIPIGLWMCAAVLAHMAGGGGAVEVAKVYEERADVRAFIRGVRAGLRPPDTTFEILTDGTEATPPSQASEPPDKPAEPSDEPPDPEAPVEPPKVAEPKPPEKKVEDLKPLEPKPEEPKPEEKKAEVEPPEPVKVVAPEPPPKDNRIAVRQHVQKDQKDNATASRIADDAHHTEQETVARIRSKDQDSADPTPGSHAGPRGEVGDSDEEKSAQSEDKPGDPSKAPGESKEAATSPEHHHPAPPAPQPKAPVHAKAAPARPATAARAPTPASPPPTPGGAGPAAPEVHDHEHGHFSLDPANPGGDGRSKSAGRKQPAAPYHNPIDVRSMGLGAQAEPGHVNTNVTLPQVAAAVGDKQLRAERAADGAARRSKHRGSWETNKFERWRAAIENYEPSVKLGNQTSLNAARVPFATYINAIHNRLHPIFAEEFLASLENLPQVHSLNDQQLVTHIEIVLSKDEGRIVRMGVTRASGVTAFDIVALNSVQRASPYGKAPEAIVSPDGNVYLHWEFHRDPFDACTTRNARPFMLKNAPTLAPPALVPRNKVPTLKPSDERMTPPGPLVPLR